MALLQTGLAKSLAEDYTIDQSLRFNAGDSPFLTRTPGSAGNQTKFTLSVWIKRSGVDTNSTFFSVAHSNTSNPFMLAQFQSDGKLRFSDMSNDTTEECSYKTTQLFRDPSSWYHIVFAVDTTDGVAVDRLKVYVNGERVTDFSTQITYSSSYSSVIDSTAPVYIGKYMPYGNQELSDYLAEYYFIDGTAYDADDFGETDTTTNQWKPKDASDLTFGTNGFYQKYGGTDFQGSDFAACTSNLTISTGTGINQIIDGTTTASSGCIPTVGQTVSAKQVTFDCGSGVTKIFTHAEFKVSMTYDDGAWKWQGSNDDVSYSDIGSGTFTIQGPSAEAGPYDITAGLSSNTTAYRYYRWQGVSGTTTGSNFWTEIMNLRDQGGPGKDSSGNGNDFTATNLVATDQMVDSPTNNFCTLNPLIGEVSSGPRMSYQTLSEGNLKSMGSTNSNSANVSSTTSFTEGKWYFEGYVVAESSSSNYPRIGIIDTVGVNDAGNGSMAGGSDTLGVTYNTDGDKRIAGTGSSYGDSFTTGDIVGMAIDADNGAAYFSKNGTWQDSGDPTSGASKTGAAYTYTGGSIEFTPSWLPYDNGGGVVNFGQDSSFAGNKTAQGNQDSNGIGDFYYEPPTDFLALCTDNLPDPEIKLPGDHFNTVLWSGDDTDPHAITGVGFQPDFLWIKSRSAAKWHQQLDAIRGVTKQVNSNEPQAETTNSDKVKSFDTDGFTLGTRDEVNGSGETYVGWNWLGDGVAGGTLNENGTLDSQVNVNTTAGFSIVAYTPTTGSATTVGHGLAQKPDLIIVKGLESSLNWPVYQSPQGATYAVWLDETNASNSSGSTGYWNDTEPTASVFTVGDSSQTGGLTEDYISYCFHSVEGYSKVGSYEGNSNADGTFVYTGFRPAYVLFKRISGAVGTWCLKDDARSPYNPAEALLSPDRNSAESDEANVDFVSNGFKLRTTEGAMNAANPILYMAFAKSPFKYANAR